MDKLISKQAAIDALTKDKKTLEHIINEMSGCEKEFDRFVGQRSQVECDIYAIEQLPPAQPEQRIGKWIPSDSQCGIQCSICGVPVDDFCHSIDYIDLDYKPNFCHNCGAKMMKGDAE